jgi:His-Xaa-Ser system protein HxsD
VDFKVEKNIVVIDLAVRLYPLDAVYGACYVFLDRCYIYLDQPEPEKVRVYLKSRDNKSELEALAGEFLNQLLHQALRLRIARQTSQVREMVVGRALLSAEPMGLAGEYDEFFDSADYLDDPLGIAVPWEEKYGKPEEQESDSNRKEENNGQTSATKNRKQ